MPNRPRIVLVALLVLAVVLRWGSFFLSVLNHDESTYIVIADELLRGGVYLRDAIDTKPIGIFWIYAALIKLTGGSIPALRLAAALTVGFGGWLLYLSGRRASGEARVGVAAGVIYCFSASVFTYYGVSPNTEIFFNLATIAAVGLAVAPRVGPSPTDPFWHWPVAGLLLGLGCVVKPFVAAEALAVGLFLLWFYGRRRAFGRLLTGGLALVGGFLLPILLVFLYYRQLGLIDELYFYTFAVGAAYPVDLAWYLRLKYVGDYLLRYSPFVVLGGLAYFRRGARPRVQGQWRWQHYLLLQFLLVTAVILVTGKRFGHYQVQLHPVIALWGATWWYGRERFARWLPAATAAAALAIGVAHYYHYGGKVDRPAAIAAYFQSRLGPEERLFTVNGFQIAYHLLDRPPPTPYVHSSLLYLAHHVRAFRIDERAEAARLLADPRLVYLVGRAEDPEAATELTRLLRREFIPYDTIGPDLRVWQRR